MTIGLVVALAGGFLVLVGAALIVYLAVGDSRSQPMQRGDEKGPARLSAKANPAGIALVSIGALLLIVALVAG